MMMSRSSTFTSYLFCFNSVNWIRPTNVVQMIEVNVNVECLLLPHAFCMRNSSRVLVSVKQLKSYLFIFFIIRLFKFFFRLLLAALQTSFMSFRLLKQGLIDSPSCFLNITEMELQKKPKNSNKFNSGEGSSNEVSLPAFNQRSLLKAPFNMLSRRMNRMQSQRTRPIERITRIAICSKDFKRVTPISVTPLM